MTYQELGGDRLAQKIFRMSKRRRRDQKIKMRPAVGSPDATGCLADRHRLHGGMTDVKANAPILMARLGVETSPISSGIGTRHQ
jgi:hypothetical protein